MQRAEPRCQERIDLMDNYLFKVTYRLRAHDMERFEEILTGEIIPLAGKLGLNLQGVWRNFVGNAGEYVELWEFDSIQQFETDWNKLISHPKLQDIFKTTGPMVEEEKSSLYQPVWKR